MDGATSTSVTNGRLKVVRRTLHQYVYYIKNVEANLDFDNVNKQLDHDKQK